MSRVSPNLEKYRLAASIDGIREWLLERSRTSSSGCREWRLAVNDKGYGVATPPGLKMMVNAHRLSYWVFVAPVPDGDWVVDHICRNPRCIEPNHLRVLSRGDNMRLADRYQSSTCKRGHQRSEENIYRWTSAGGVTRRVCLPCRALKVDQYNANRRNKRQAAMSAS